MFIVITGLDGSGTSTIAKKLHEIDSESYLFHTPGEIFTDRKVIDKEIREVSQNAHYLYYLSSVVYLSDYIKKYIDYKNYNVYCVRYLIDTVVSHRVAGLDVALEYERYNILKPDLTVFVTLSEETRQKRITNRGKSFLDCVLDEEKTRKAFLNEFAKQMTKNSIMFDNGADKIDDKLWELYQTQIRKEK